MSINENYIEKKFINTLHNKYCVITIIMKNVIKI